MALTVGAASVVDDSSVSLPSSDRDPRGDLDAEPSSVAGPTVIPLSGEHDSSTAVSLTAMLTTAITLEDADLVVDLRDVTFIDASTLGALVGIRIALGRRGRALVLRSPSSLARRVFAICGLSDLVEASPAASSPHVSKGS